MSRGEAALGEEIDHIDSSEEKEMLERSENDCVRSRTKHGLVQSMSSSNAFSSFQKESIEKSSNKGYDSSCTRESR